MKFGHGQKEIKMPEIQVFVCRERINPTPDLDTISVAYKVLRIFQHKLCCLYLPLKPLNAAIPVYGFHSAGSTAVEAHKTELPMPGGFSVFCRINQEGNRVQQLYAWGTGHLRQA